MGRGQLVIVVFVFLMCGLLTRNASAQQSSHLLLGPTAWSLPQGEGYVRAVEVLPMVQYGVTDQFSFGGGVFLPALLAGGSGSELPIVLTPKLQVQRSAHTATAIGLVNIGVRDPIGAAYAVHTHDFSASSVTVGLVGGYSGRGLAHGASLMAAFEHKTSDRVSLVSENYIMRGNVVSLAGVRLERRRGTLECGVALFAERRFFSAAPMVNFGYKF